MVLRIPAIEIAVMIAERNEVFGAGLGIQPDQFFRIPVLRMPDVADIFVPELGRMPVCLDVIVVLRTALHVHTAEPSHRATMKYWWGLLQITHRSRGTCRFTDVAFELRKVAPGSDCRPQGRVEFAAKEVCYASILQMDAVGM
jgi:hypothetical protein